MEKRKTNISFVIYCLLLIILSVFTIYKINKNHEKKLYNVLYSEIEYKAKKCYLDKVCSDSFTLSFLYEKEYLDTMYDPISKEELDKKLKINIKKNKVIIEK